jgi:glutathione S-transferase
VLFNPKMSPETKEAQLGTIERCFNALEKMVTDKQFIMGDNFIVADAHLFSVLRRTNMLKIDLGKWPNLRNFVTRVAARRAVQETMKAEGLLK